MSVLVGHAGGLGPRHAVSLLMLLVLLVAFVLPSCQSRDIPAPNESQSASSEPTPAPEVDPDTDEPQATETPRRKGTRIIGGIPPIRRADLISALTVPGAQRFLLGGGQPSSFFSDIENTGDTEVLISASRGPGTIVVARLSPGDSASHRFQPTETAVIANLDPTEPAKVRLRVWGDTNLQMRYEPR